MSGCGGQAAGAERECILGSFGGQTVWMALSEGCLLLIAAYAVLRQWRTGCGERVEITPPTA